MPNWKKQEALSFLLSFIFIGVFYFAIIYTKFKHNIYQLITGTVSCRRQLFKLFHSFFPDPDRENLVAVIAFERRFFCNLKLLCHIITSNIYYNLTIMYLFVIFYVIDYVIYRLQRRIVMDYLTLSEAMSKWKISSDRLLILLAKGMIRGVVIKDNKILLPSHKTIKIPKDKQKVTVEYVIKTILEMCNEFGYVDNRLLGIDEADFAEIITAMESGGLLKRKNKNKPLYSNENYMITAKGSENLNKKRFTLKSFEIGFKTKLFSLKADFERS